MRFTRYIGGDQDIGFLPVLVAAILMFGVSPVLSDSDPGLAVLNLLAFAVLLGALRASGWRGRLFRIAVILGAIGWLLGAAEAIGVEINGPRLLLTYGLWFVAPIAVLRRVMSDRRVTMNTIYGAITAYFLFGLLMGFQYTAMEEIESGSFAIPSGIEGRHTQDLLYYSLVTQTTLGFGDITPVKAAPRAVSVIQAVMGQMYLVVLVARLVALQIAHANEGR